MLSALIVKQLFGAAQVELSLRVGSCMEHRIQTTLVRQRKSRVMGAASPIKGRQATTTILLS